MRTFATLRFLRNVCFVLLSLSSIGIAGTIGDELANTGSLSGKVQSERPFEAAKVYAYNPERHMTYMVYTHNGRYRAVHLFPGEYQVRVEHPGFSADMQTLQIVKGKEAKAEFTLRPSSDEVVSGAGTKFDPQLAVAPYEEIYPPGPGKATIERTCINCHGVNFIPGRPTTEQAWDAILNMMLSDRPAYGVVGGAPMIPQGTVSDSERAELLTYLVDHFGPNAVPRAVQMDAPLEVDEEVLSKAMWVEYSVAEPKAENGAHRWIQEPYFDLDGNVWFTERTRGSGAILKLDPRTAEFQRYPTTDPNWSPHGLAVDPVDAQVWWGGRNIYLGRLDPKTGKHRAYETPGPGLHGHTPVFDSKNDLWFSMLPGNKIGKWDRSSDKITVWENPTPGGRPYGILIDQNDKIWYAEFHSCMIARFDPVTEEFDEYETPSAPCTIRRIGLDSQGKIWYGVYSEGRLGVFDPSTNKFEEFEINRFSEPYEPWADSEDNIWMSDGGQGGVLIKFDQASRTFTNYPSPMRSDMPKIAITRDDALWYSNRSIAMAGSAPATVGVLYPDKQRINTFGAYYQLQNGRAVGSGSPRPPIGR